MLKSRRILLTIAFIACFTGLRGICDMFWPLLVTGKLGIAAENLSIFSTIKTLLMLCQLYISCAEAQSEALPQSRGIWACHCL